MDFEIKIIKRNITNNEIVNDIKRVSVIYKKNTLTTEEYNKYGQYHASTIIRRFGSWTKALIESGLDFLPKQRYRISREEIITDILSVAKVFNPLSLNQYKGNGKFTLKVIIREFGSWNNALRECKLPIIDEKIPITREDCLNEILRIWTIIGRQPTTNDIKKGISKYSLNTFCRKFGSWGDTLVAFDKFIHSGEKPTEEAIFENNDYPEEIKKVKRKTNRDPGSRLRYRVLERDKFKCCACGASPATDTSIVLHVDHIIPWSKGGETTIDNLQTLCSKCNYGKSDLL